MKIAILADIHGNLDALEAVLGALQAEPIDHYIVAGDMVGYYDQPDAVCSRIRGLQNASVVRGNHDDYVCGALEPNPKNRDAYRVDWTRENLSQDNLAWLGGLPVAERMIFDDVLIAARHASPWDMETYLYPDTDISKITLKEREILVLGHTHYPMDRPAGAGRIINPGSVGQPRDRRPGACFAVFDTVSMAVTFYRQAYDILSMQERLRAAGWRPSVIELLSRT